MRTSRKKIGILDEGVSIIDDVDSLDFVGDGVDASLISGGYVQINIPGGGSISGALVSVTGTIDDSNISFTVAAQPSVLVINGGVYKQSGGSITWSYIAGTITLSTPVGTGGSIYGIK